ncbi:hypothetical protein [Vibrio nomapromontoriensis]|uniref:hypothetical protein n=1 Tax=Vibrio nomapromontoriensis TaxID=2910246 RepID=UPI003D096B2E
MNKIFLVILSFVALGFVNYLLFDSYAKLTGKEVAYTLVDLSARDVKTVHGNAKIDESSIKFSYSIVEPNNICMYQVHVYAQYTDWFFITLMRPQKVILGAENNCQGIEMNTSFLQNSVWDRGVYFLVYNLQDKMCFIGGSQARILCLIKPS